MFLNKSSFLYHYHIGLVKTPRQYQVEVAVSVIIYGIIQGHLLSGNGYEFVSAKLKKRFEAVQVFADM